MDGPDVPDDRQRRNLTAVLGFLQLPPKSLELRLLHEWGDSWGGVGALVAGLYDIHLTQYGDNTWRATFYVTGLAHSILGGSAWEPTVWRAVQRAGWDALQHAERNL